MKKKLCDCDSKFWEKLSNLPPPKNIHSGEGNVIQAYLKDSKKNKAFNT